MFGRRSTRPVDRFGFKIGIVCALPLEADQVEMAFDERWSQNDIDYGRASNDFNTYTIGVIAGQNVVLTYCSHKGTICAAHVASSLRSSFTNIEIIIIVGVCGAVPTYVNAHEPEPEDIWLGDCLISTAIFEIDFGRQQPQNFRMQNTSDGVRRSNTLIDGILAKLQTRGERHGLTENLNANLQEFQRKDPKWASYLGVQHDRLYCAQTCAELGCERQCHVLRTRSGADTSPRIHFGHFGSSNAVLASGLHRDELAKAHRIIAFEMEGAGIRRLCPTIIIKAACDYADNHKNKDWQRYSAAVAAAGLKAFLSQAYPSTRSQSSSSSSFNTITPWTTSETTSSVRFEPWNLPAHGIATAVISSDFTMLAYGPGDSTRARNATIRVLSLQDGAFMHELVAKDQTQVRSLAFCPDGRLLASGHGGLWYRQKRGWGETVGVKILLWNVEKKTYRTCEPNMRRKMIEPTITMSFNSQGNLLAVVYSSKHQNENRPGFFIIAIDEGTIVHQSAESWLGSRMGMFSPDDQEYFIYQRKEITVTKADNHEKDSVNISVADSATAVFGSDGLLRVLHPNGNIDTYYQDRVQKEKLKIEPNLSFERNTKTLGLFQRENEPIIIVMNIGSKQLCIASPGTSSCKMLPTNGTIVKVWDIHHNGQYLAWLESTSSESSCKVRVCNIKEELGASNGSCLLEEMEEIRIAPGNLGSFLKVI